MDDEPLYYLASHDIPTDNGLWKRLTLDINVSRAAKYKGPLVELVGTVFDKVCEIVMENLPDLEHNLTDSHLVAPISKQVEDQSGI